MLIEIDGDDMHFQAVSDKGVTLDAGTVNRTAPTPTMAPIKK